MNKIIQFPKRNSTKVLIKNSIARTQLMLVSDRNQMENVLARARQIVKDNFLDDDTTTRSLLNKLQSIASTYENDESKPMWERHRYAARQMAKLLSEALKINPEIKDTPSPDEMYHILINEDKHAFNITIVALLIAFGSVTVVLTQ